MVLVLIPWINRTVTILTQNCFNPLLVAMRLGSRVVSISCHSRQPTYFLLLWYSVFVGNFYSQSRCTFRGNFFLWSQSRCTFRVLQTPPCVFRDCFYFLNESRRFFSAFRPRRVFRVTTKRFLFRGNFCFQPKPSVFCELTWLVLFSFLWMSRLISVLKPRLCSLWVYRV